MPLLVAFMKYKLQLTSSGVSSSIIPPINGKRSEPNPKCGIELKKKKICKILRGRLAETDVLSLKLQGPTYLGDIPLQKTVINTL